MLRLWRLWLVALLLIAGAAPVVASSSSEPQECRTVRFGVVGFSDVAAVTALTSEVLKPLGYSPTSINLSVPIIFSSMQAGSVDVFLGNWMPAQEGDSKPYLANKSVEVVGPNLEKAKFTLAVPHYLYEAGLRDFASITQFATQLNSTLYGIEPGAAANRLVLDMIKSNTFGLGHFRLVESSEQGMLAEVERAYRARKPIVFVGWDPHPMNLRFQIDYLSGGDAVFGPDFGGATINTVTRAGLSAQCPNLGRLLRNLKFSLRGESELMEAMLDKHEQPDVAAQKWLALHPEALRQWLVGVTTVDGRPPPEASNSSAGGDPVTSGRGAFERWMVAHKIPLGDAVAGGLELLKSRGSRFFDGVSAVVGGLVAGVSQGLRLVPAWVFIVVATLLTALLKRTWTLTVLVPLALLFILNQGYWAPMLETLSLVLVATVTSVALGIPVGIAAAHHPHFSATLRPVLDLMQTLPTFVYLIPTLVLFGLGPVPGLISTVVFAIAAPIRLTEEGIAAVPGALKEVGKAFGATRFQLLWKVELPSATPLILAGVTQCIMLSLSMVVVAALVGAGGLGVPVIRALGSVQIGVGFDAGLIIVLLAIVLDRISRPRDRR
jgi:glycine betaine/proline transport system substrate-binding protein